MSWVNNDYIYQNASTIYYKHNIHSSPWWLERWCPENMCLFVHNVQPNIPSNGGEKISNYIMCGRVFSSMNTTNMCIPIKFMAWLHMHWKRSQVVGWGMSNLVHNDEEKMLEAILKDGMIGWVKGHIWIWTYTRSQLNAITIWKQPWNDVGKWMIVHTFLDGLLKTVHSCFW